METRKQRIEAVKIEMNSDFTDYYDSELSRTSARVSKPGEVFNFNRKVIPGMTKWKKLDKLTEIGWNVPPFGQAMDLCEALPIEAIYKGDQVDCFLFLEDSPSRQKKVKMNLFEAAEKYPNNLAMLYIPTKKESDGKVSSVKYVRVGKEHFFVKLTSDHSYCSDEGNVEMSYLNNTFGINLAPLSEEDPLFSVNMIQSEGGVWYAVGYNKNPVLRDSPLEDRLPPEEVSYLIKEFFLSQNNV